MSARLALLLAVATRAAAAQAPAPPNAPREPRTELLAGVGVPQRALPALGPYRGALGAGTALGVRLAAPIGGRGLAVHLTSSAVVGSRLVVEGPDLFGHTREERTAPAFVALTLAAAGERRLARELTGHLALGGGVRGYVGAGNRVCLTYAPSPCPAADRYADRPTGLTTVGTLGVRRALGRAALSVEVGDYVGREAGAWRQTVVTWLGLRLP